MQQLIRLAAWAMVLVAFTSAAQARGHSGGRYGPAHSFSYSHCVSSSCYAKHLGGTYLHPNTGRGGSRRG